ncbi:MAG: aminomethyl-transferring glycine dehydrogenase subunit GcvPB [Caldilineae bacterium]|nr:aminomethyl-transferring glycine dehydrogenase subunit GcvPB [Anaerolineae bacterium]MCB0203622.1 aminomethyl-transferring glycine dehydrogenase subunit GcvPB [Anaerolineae bacterium]MCB0254601.1 aminomethyl-transferring glycine dehydrogenase subunit GcvPB [Anaerolineae bacterium]MCB9155079.1 aminomethyl-transferring glycine dehydrogenase subunit GcvPB [Caldilineae bacterium]
MIEPTVYDLSSPGRHGPLLPVLDVPEAPLPDGYLREDLLLPELSELDTVRHFVRLSQRNMGIDTNFYPLGSCTMKYNPKVNEKAAGLAGFTDLHPLQDAEMTQGAMQLLLELQVYLAEISGFDAVTLQPAAGAQGELTGVLMMRKYQLDRGETQRTKILVPDSAHGTNPATTTMSGLQVVELPSSPRGNLDLEALKANLDDTVVGLMLTNPNTLGLFEERILEITQLVHEAGGLVYGDGANMNAIVGVVKPADLGIDVMHFNLHKTFSTPHGGGGPGAGPVGVVAKLAPFLPGPVVSVEHIPDDFDDEEEHVHFDEDGDDFRLIWHMPSKSIGRVRSYYGNFGVLVRAYTYIRMHGAPGLRRIAENAVLNANYLKARLQQEASYPVAFGDRICMHEFVAQGILEGAPDIHTMDIAKRLMDYGFHPPTVYFPLIVREALMIEPTETESKATLDAFADAMIQIAREAREEPELLKDAPHSAPVKRLDEVRAARQMILCRC